MRGCSYPIQGRKNSSSVFPAGAGVLLIRHKINTCFKSFPRRCGGAPKIYLWVYFVLLFSPQVRGCSCRNRKRQCSSGVFPAGAGVLLSYTVSFRKDVRFPRRCGGAPNRLSTISRFSWFSPQVRGCSYPSCMLSSKTIVFPAGAGVLPLSLV